MAWIALVLVVALAAGVLGTVLELALWAVAVTVLVLVAGGVLLARALTRDRSGAART